jgi:lysophospholipase L1-like esterase
MKKMMFVLLGVLIILLCTYLWYARASIYWKLGDLPIYAPSDFTSYSIGEKSATPLTYVAIGDSLTAGVGVDTYTESYPYLIAIDLSEDSKKGIDLIPFAIPGIRSEYVVGYFLEPVIETRPDVITVFIGTNDIHGNVGADKFKERYELILATVTKETEAEVYVVNLPYIGTKDLILQPYRYYFNWRTQQYNAIIKELAIQYDVTYVDLYSVHAPHALDNTYYARDFFHPNTLGYTLWAKTIYANFNQ